MGKNEGVALITESFSAIVPNFPTHLKLNFKYADKTPFLFLRHNLLFKWFIFVVLSDAVYKKGKDKPNW